MYKYILKSCRRSIMICILFVLIINSNKIFSSSIDKAYVDITSPSAVVIDFESGRVLYDKNCKEQRSIASLTKVMTSILLVEYCSMDEKIEVPAAATWQGGSEVGLKKGDIVTAKALLYGMLLPSGNDCAYTVAIHIAGSIEQFAELMNKKAKEIGALNSNFVTPHGLDIEGQYSCAYDLAVIMRYALKNKYINEVVNTDNIQIDFGSFTKTLTNTNRLLRTYAPVDGGKTGYTADANRCLVTSATKDDLRIISVVLGAETTDKRFNETKLLLEETFKRYKLRDVSCYMNWYVNIPVKKGNVKYYEDKISKSMKVALTDYEYDNMYVKQDYLSNIDAPLDMNTLIGNVGIVIEDEVIYSEDIYLKYDITKNNLFDYLNMGILHMFDSRSKI